MCSHYINKFNKTLWYDEGSLRDRKENISWIDAKNDFLNKYKEVADFKRYIGRIVKNTEKYDKMKTYIYPENLRATVKLWFWNVRDFIVICSGIILSVIVFVNLWNVLPIAATVCYGFLSLRVDDTAIMDYIFNAVKFFVTSQQTFYWNKGD